MILPNPCFLLVCLLNLIILFKFFSVGVSAGGEIPQNSNVCHIKSRTAYVQDTYSIMNNCRWQSPDKIFWNSAKARLRPKSAVKSEWNPIFEITNWNSFSMNDKYAVETRKPLKNFDFGLWYYYFATTCIFNALFFSFNSRAFWDVPGVDSFQSRAEAHFSLDFS